MAKRRGYQGTRSESRDVNSFFGKGPYKSNVDDKPKRTPKDRNTGSPAERRLRGKVIG